MKISFEKTILGSLALTLVIYVFNDLLEHPDVILYRLSELTVFLTAFFFMAFRWTGDPCKTWSTRQRWSLMALFWVFSWFLMSLTKIVMDLLPENDPILLTYFFLPYVADNFLEPMIPGLAIGIIYGAVRQLIIKKDKKKLKILGAVTGA
jgi:hypothetical protein